MTELVRLVLQASSPQQARALGPTAPVWKEAKGAPSHAFLSLSLFVLASLSLSRPPSLSLPLGFELIASWGDVNLH